jgi:hypothetical protein
MSFVRTYDTVITFSDDEEEEDATIVADTTETIRRMRFRKASSRKEQASDEMVIRTVLEKLPFTARHGKKKTKDSDNCLESFCVTLSFLA